MTRAIRRPELAGSCPAGWDYTCEAAPTSREQNASTLKALMADHPPPRFLGGMQTPWTFDRTTIVMLSFVKQPSAAPVRS